MYYIKSTKQYVHEGTEFEVKGVTFSAGWIYQASQEQKDAIGMQEVTTIGEYKNSMFYWPSETLDGATRTIVNTPKDVDQVKYALEKYIKNTVYNILKDTDYIDIRNLRDPSYKPEWVTWRDSIRTASSEAVIAINNALDIETLEAIMSSLTFLNDPSYVAPAETIVAADMLGKV